MPANFLLALGKLCTSTDRDDCAGFFGGRSARFRSGAPKYRQALERIELCVAAHGAPAAIPIPPRTPTT